VRHRGCLASAWQVSSSNLAKHLARGR
jgi:hypothetical protein